MEINTILKLSCDIIKVLERFPSTSEETLNIRKFECIWPKFYVLVLPNF